MPLSGALHNLDVRHGIRVQATLGADPVHSPVHDGALMQHPAQLATSRIELLTLVALVSGSVERELQLSAGGSEQVGGRHKAIMRGRISGTGRAAHMVNMTDITPAAVAARESAREAGGQFGAQNHSAPEAALAEISARAARVQEMERRLRALRAEADALESTIKLEKIGAVWEHVPLAADAVVFDVYDSGFGPRVEFGGIIDAIGDEMVQEYDDEYREAASWLVPSDLDYDETLSGPAIQVGKEATRERILALEEDHRTGASGRAGAHISEDMAVAVTRYLRQVAAEQGWDSIELTWDQDGREGLRADVIVKAGKRYKAGSGHLDDHEALWAAARYDRPVPTKMTTEHGVVGPFIIDFTN